MEVKRHEAATRVDKVRNGKSGRKMDQSLIGQKMKAQKS